MAISTFSSLLAFAFLTQKKGRASASLYESWLLVYNVLLLTCCCSKMCLQITKFKNYLNHYQSSICTLCCNGMVHRTRLCKVGVTYMLCKLFLLLLLVNQLRKQQWAVASLGEKRARMAPPTLLGKPCPKFFVENIKKTQICVMIISHHNTSFSIGYICLWPICCKKGAMPPTKRPFVTKIMKVQHLLIQHHRIHNTPSL